MKHSAHETCLNQWLCGGVSGNYHLLANLRALNGELLELRMIDSVAVLLHQELITLDTVTQDGMKVREHSGSSSFRKQQTLEQTHQVVTRHLEDLKKQREADPSGVDRLSRAAQKRAAEERERRLLQAHEELKKLEENRNKQRAAGKDPCARKPGDSDRMAAFRFGWGHRERRQFTKLVAALPNFRMPSGAIVVCFSVRCEV